MISFKIETPNKFHNIGISCWNYHENFDIEKLIKELTPIENELFRDIVSEKRKKTFLGGRLCAKIAIENLLNMKCKEKISIGKGIHNQPIVKNLHHPGIQVSITHSGHSIIAIAFYEDHPCGIDLEYLDLSNQKTLENQLSLNEIKQYMSVVIPKISFLTMVWTAKESLSKILKTGLTLPLNFFEISTIEDKDLFWECSYKHFTQYKSISFLHSKKICTLSLPIRSKVPLHALEKLANFFINADNDSEKLQI